MLRASGIALFVSASALAIGCASATSDSDRSHATGRTSAAVLDGVRDETHLGVVAVYHADDTAPELCSGFVVTNDLVLTARHCVGPLDNPSGGCSGSGATLAGEPWPATTMTVHLETEFGVAAKVVRVAEVRTLDGSTGRPICGADVAFVRLAKPLDGIEPIPLRVDAPPVASESILPVGYGASAGGPDTTSGTRRSHDGSSVSSVGASATTTIGEWIVDHGPCAGDSGSPALDAHGVAVGVMSRGSKATCTSMIYERLDVHADFLRAEVLASAARLGVDPPSWATGKGDAGDVDASSDASSDADLGDGGDTGGAPSPAAASNGGCAYASSATEFPWLLLASYSVLAWRRRRAPHLTRSSNARLVDPVLQNASSPMGNPAQVASLTTSSRVRRSAIDRRA